MDSADQLMNVCNCGDIHTSLGVRAQNHCGTQPLMQCLTCRETVSRYGHSFPSLFCVLSFDGAYRGRSSSSDSKSSVLAFLLDAEEGSTSAFPFSASSTDLFMGCEAFSEGIFLG